MAVVNVVITHRCGCQRCYTLAGVSQPVMQRTVAQLKAEGCGLPECPLRSPGSWVPSPESGTDPAPPDPRLGTRDPGLKGRILARSATPAVNGRGEQ